MPYIGNTPALDYISYAVQNFTVTAGTTSYALDYSVANENDIRLVINNVIQRPGASYAYSATGTTLTLTSATLATDTMYAVFIGRAVQTVTPAANSITNTMLTPSVITGQTAETSIAGGDSILIYDDSASALRKMTIANLGNTPAFHARMSANQTLSNATLTKVQFNTEEFDTASAYDTSTYRFTVPSGQAGKYFIYSSILGKSDDVPSDLQAVKLAIYKNGSIISINGTDPRNAGFGYFFSAYSHVTLSLVANDYIEIFGYIIIVSGTPIITNDSQTYTNSFGAYKLIGA